MNTLNLIFVVTISAVFCGQMKAQTPSNDQNWQLNLARSDDFDNGPVDLSKWCVLNNCTGTGTDPCICWNWGGCSYFSSSSSNVYISNNQLNLVATQPSCSTCCPQGTGGIKSRNADYTYGYYEIYAQLPGFVDGNGVGHGDKFWPAFWIYRQDWVNNCIVVHDEIDIIDQCCTVYNDAKTTGSGWVNEDGNCGTVAGPWVDHVSSTHLCNTFHKFAVEWNTDRIIFYFDDTPYYETYNDPAFIMSTLQVVIDLQIMNTNYSFYPGTQFPQDSKYIIDYFNYHQLKRDCNTNYTILNNTDLTNYTGSVVAVKSNITFGNGLNSVTFSAAHNKVFRAVNSITVNGDFTVPSGIECVLLPTPCN